jgi:uncharacterized membrane protein HdeD (DUF308 family)
MAKKMENRTVKKNKGANYMVLVGVVVLLIGFGLAVFARQVDAGLILLLLGVLISVLGLSKHSMHLLKRRASKA